MSENPAIDVLRKELEELNSEIASAKEKQKSIMAALRVLSGKSLPAPSAPKAAKPAKSRAGSSKKKKKATIRDEILNVLEVSGDGFKPSGIGALLRQSGRSTSNTSVSTTLTRMRREGDAVNRNGRWFLPG